MFIPGNSNPILCGCGVPNKSLGYFHKKDNHECRFHRCETDHVCAQHSCEQCAVGPELVSQIELYLQGYLDEQQRDS